MAVGKRFLFRVLVALVSAMTLGTGLSLAAPSPQLNLSSIGCPGDGTGDQVQVHFVVVNLPDGVTPLDLTVTGRWPGGTGSQIIPAPTKVSGPTYHYSFFGASGFYRITGATLNLSSGAPLSLHNPNEYTDLYRCPSICRGIASCSGWEVQFMHPLVEVATINVYASADMGATWVLVGTGSAGPTTEEHSTTTGSWLTTMPAPPLLIKYQVTYLGVEFVTFSLKPRCSS